MSWTHWRRQGAAVLKIQEDEGRGQKVVLEGEVVVQAGWAFVQGRERAVASAARTCARIIAA